MEQPVFDQLICALISIGGGILFGVVYDLFKALRLKIKRLGFSLFADLVVCLFGLSLLFLLFMSIGGGQARLYVVICAGAGALAYFLGASFAVLDFFTGILGVVAAFLHLMEKYFSIMAKKLKIIYKNVKLFFQKACNWFTIMVKSKVDTKLETPSKSGDLEREHNYEAQTRRFGGEAGHSRAGNIRRHKSGRPKAADRKRAGKA